MPTIKRKFTDPGRPDLDMVADDILIVVLGGGSVEKELSKHISHVAEITSDEMRDALAAFIAGSQRLLYMTRSHAQHKAGAVTRMLGLYNATRMPVTLGNDPECAGHPRRENCGLPNVLHRPAAPMWSVLIDRRHAERLIMHYELYPLLECGDQDRLARVLGLFATDMTGLCLEQKQRTKKDIPI
jgi:hypothetical protein